ncbi:NCS2 family permease [Cetobacterium sp. SF1]|uniref:NCS2 family permease n=1 Tax=unclassified Cetobacterium TaxID=2630983 RepID=UPI003CF06CB2
MEFTAKATSNKGFLDTYFKISERNSSIKQEVIGGITTFLAMSYIIFVNPAILSTTGMEKGALITVTILATAIGTMISGFWGKSPLAIGPGMGLNAFFTYTLVLGKGVPWETALGVVFISGLFFMILAIGGIREKLANAIPRSISTAAAAGIGLFIALIGLKNMGVIVPHPATMVALGHFDSHSLLAILGLTLMAIFEMRQIKGGILLSILITTIIGIFIGLVNIPTEFISMPPSMAPIAMKLDILSALKFSLMGPIFSFMFIDLFDSLGFLIACCKEMGLENEKGEIKALGRMLHADVASTIIGAIMGTSTMISLAESATGIAAGARTGLAAIVTAILMLFSLFFTPIVAIVPMFAVAPAMVMVGVYMFKNVKDIDFSDMKIAVSSFVTIFMMPLTYSISIGLSFGFLAYIILHIGAGEIKKISLTLWLIGSLSLINLLI